MSTPTCPTCSATLRPTDLTEGWCDACGKQLPAHLTTGRTPTTRAAEGLGENPRPRADETYWGFRSRTGGGVTASLGARFNGALFDSIFGTFSLLPGFGVIFYLVTQGASSPQEDEALAFLAFATLGAGVLLLTAIQLTLLSLRGQTLGKKLAGTRIVYLDGSPPGFLGAVLLRNFVPGLISGIPFVGGLFAIVDVLWIFGDDTRRLADLIAGTKVVTVR